MGQQPDRNYEIELDAGQEQALATRGEAEAAVCRLQRDAEYGIGCESGGDAAADPAYSGGKECGVQRDEPEL